jgi:tRNA nucleotidyltransferase (CCA-adding enzyme)
MKNVTSLVKERLKKEQIVLLDSIAKMASIHNVSVYVVGGFVRDLLLNIENLDLDLVVEGDGISFSNDLAEKFFGSTKSHHEFGTSKLTLQDDSHVDVATARTEHYSHSAALPKIKPSSIKLDLARRDFTVNSMAIKLDKQGMFFLIDIFGGENDLKKGFIRVLHDLSFIDDPSRIFRAVRFEQRFNFRIDDETRDLMLSAIESKLIDQLSGQRVINEIKLILNEYDPKKCVDRMRELYLFQTFSPEISSHDFNWSVIEKIDSALIWLETTISISERPKKWRVYFLGLFITMKGVAFEKSVKRLHLSVKISNWIRLDRKFFDEAKRYLDEERELKPSQVYDIFSKLSSEAVVLLLAACFSERVCSYTELYFNQYCELAKIKLTGDDLMKMGMQPGPAFNNIFKALRDARINGQVVSRNEEVIFVRSNFL